MWAAPYTLTGSISRTADSSNMTTSTPASSTFTEEWLPGPEDTQFYTRTYAAVSPPCAVVLFVHGFAEYVARYE